jgi:hypothetical protein
MDDSFTLGRGGKRPTDAPPKHAGRHGAAGTFERSRLVWGIAAAAVAIVVVAGFLKFMGNAGNEIGADNQKIVEQIGAAKDTQAELTANETIQNATQIYTESGSFADVTADALAASEPTFRYVTGASTDPDTVSVAATESGVGLAVRSDSGTCLYAFVQPSRTTYGTGGACTGDAATTGATGPAWPSH